MAKVYISDKVEATATLEWANLNNEVKLTNPEPSLPSIRAECKRRGYRGLPNHPKGRTELI